MLRSWVPSSSAQRIMSTLFQRVPARAWKEAAGNVASGSKHPWGSLSSSVSRSRIRGSGWKPSEKSLPNPWPQRIMLVRHYSCIHSYVTCSCLVLESRHWRFIFVIHCIVDEASWRRGKWLVLPTGLQWFRMLDLFRWFNITERYLTVKAWFGQTPASQNTTPYFLFLCNCIITFQCFFN